MKIIYLFIILIVSIDTSSETISHDRSSNNYKYTSIGIHFIESEKSGVAINLSLDLPGSFYFTLERKADGIDYKNESYDKVVDTARLGAHIGIGDLIGRISAGDFNFKLNNLFDIFAEVGIKTSDFDGEKFNFQGDDTYASYLAGIRFGDSNKLEGKLFLDVTREAKIIETSNPSCLALNCPPYEAEISDDSDKKFGIGVLYNINSRNAFFIEISTSQVLDNMVKIGYQLNF